MSEWIVTYSVFDSSDIQIIRVQESIYHATERDATIEAEKRAAKLCNSTPRGDYWLVHSVK